MRLIFIFTLLFSLVALSQVAPMNTSVIKKPSSSTINTIQPTDPAFVPLVIKGAASQTGDLIQIKASGGTNLFRVRSDGKIIGDGSLLSGLVSPVWGVITGLLSDQADLQAALDAKQAVLTLGNLTDAGTDGITVTTGTGAVVGSGTSISQHVADSTHNGYLSSANWTTFNNKQSALTLGNLTDVGTDGISVTGGTGSVVGSGVSIAQQVSDTTHNGYLSQTDWNTFNGKQAAGSYVTTARTISTTAPITGGGDLSANRTFAIPVSTNSVDGYLSGADHTTFNAKESALTFSSPLSRATNTISIPAATSLVNGYLTSADWTTFNGKQAAGSYANSTTTISTTAPITGGGDLSTNRTIAMPVSTNSVDGYLSGADHTTFNAKQNQIKIAVIEEQQAHGVDGGTATTGGWNDRVLNTTVSDDIGITLSANVFTLPAGTYLISWGSPFMGTVNRGSTRILNTTDSTVTAYSINTSIMAAGVYYLSWGESGKFTITGSKSFKLQYQVGTTVATTGLGAQSTGTNGLTNNETYSHVKITQF